MNRRRILLLFHWLTALLVALSFTIAWLRKPVEDLAVRAFWLDVHRSIGMIVLLLTVTRLGLRGRKGPISKGEDLPVAMWIASRLTHVLLYAGLIAMPLLGWAQSSAKVRHLNLFGVPIPALVRHNRDLADSFGWWHEQVGWALLALIGLHAAAGLFHHYVRRDDVLRSMLPRGKPITAKVPSEVQTFDIAA